MSKAIGANLVFYGAAAEMLEAKELFKSLLDMSESYLRMAEQNDRLQNRLDNYIASIAKRLDVEIQDDLIETLRSIDAAIDALKEKATICQKRSTKS